MKKLTYLLAAILLVLPTLASAVPIFTGSLSTPSGVVSSAGWDPANGGFQISWVVTQLSTDDWYYQYTLSNVQGGALAKNPSHLIIEISPNATASDFWTFNGGWELNTYSGANPSNPGMPGAVYGLKMAGVQNSGSGLFEYFFHSVKAPTWGDFYAKDGKWAPTGTPVTAWNTDFLQADPTAMPQNGLLVDVNGRPIYKILRPDTQGQTHITPEPGTVLLLGAGLCGLALVRRKK